MAEFQAGDRMVKMSGNWAGRYGTVNSVMDNGTLNVTFDGERIPKYCNPELCGKVAANAFKVGDKVKHKTNGLTGIVEGRATEPGNYNVRSEGRVFMWDEDDLVLANACAANAVEFDNPNYKPEAGMKYLDEHFSWFDPKVAKKMIEDARRKGVKVPPGVLEKARKAGLIANSTAANATFKVGDRVRLAGIISPGLGKMGVVVKVDGEWGDVTVKTDDGKTYQYEASAVQKVANSRAANAKFKVGDRVVYWFFNEPYKGTVVRSTDYTTSIKFDNKPPAWMPQVAELPTDKIVRSNSTARNAVEVEVSLSYAGRVQHAMRDAARSVSGVRMTSSNTLVCPDDDAADDVIEIIKSAGVPADEVWTNARKHVARNTKA